MTTVHYCDQCHIEMPAGGLITISFSLAALELGERRGDSGAFCSKSCATRWLFGDAKP